MNNPDRLPAIWNNGGNGGNIFFEVEMTAGIINKDDLLRDPKNLNDINILNVVAIDNSTLPMST